MLRVGSSLTCILLLTYILLLTCNIHAESGQQPQRCRPFLQQSPLGVALARYWRRMLAHYWGRMLAQCALGLPRLGHSGQRGRGLQGLGNIGNISNISNISNIGNISKMRTATTFQTLVSWYIYCIKARLRCNVKYIYYMLRVRWRIVPCSASIWRRILRLCRLKLAST